MKNFIRPQRQKSQAVETPVDIDVFPGYTEYKSLCCCCTQIQDGTIFCTKSQWEISLCMPITVNLLAISALFVFAFFCTTKFLIFGIVYSIFLFILCILFLTAYAKTIYIGPGYFPFYYQWSKEERLPQTDDPTVIGVKESFAGITSTKIQGEWARGQNRPPRSTYAGSAKRFVIRPDHFCGWVGTWIGKRNHKFFLLFNAYGCLYLTFLLIGYIVYFIIAFRKMEKYETVIIFIFAMFTICFIFMTCSFVLSGCQAARRNQTQWEKWQNIPEDAFDKGDPELNLEDVFGKDQSKCNRICLCNPWKYYSNEELVEDYITYADAKAMHTHPASVNQNVNHDAPTIANQNQAEQTQL